MNIIRILMTSFILIMFTYSAHQLTRFADFSLLESLSIILFLLFVFLFILGTFAYSWKFRDRPNQTTDRLMNVALTLMAYVNFLLCFLILRDGIALVQSLLNMETDEIYNRQASYGLLLLPVPFLILGNIVVRLGAKVKKIQITFPNLPENLDGFRILHITDLHIGPSVSPHFVHKVVEKANALSPDMMVFTGDILDSFAERHTQEHRLISKLKARHGIFYVTGNHEYYWNAKSSIEYFETAGFETLQNQVENIYLGTSVLQIAGVNDPAARQFAQEGPNFDTLKHRLQDESFKILLSHQPRLCHEAEKSGFDLQLSGHTHGGQFFPWNLLIVFFERYSKGLYNIGRLKLYVNQGTGYWGPQLRLGTYCELAEIVLRKQGKTE